VGGVGGRRRVAVFLEITVKATLQFTKASRCRCLTSSKQHRERREREENGIQNLDEKGHSKIEWQADGGVLGMNEKQ
jgi:hypothetical protein